MSVYIIYPIAVLMTLFALGIVVINNKLSRTRHIFDYVYSGVTFGLIFVMWYAIYLAIRSGDIIGWWTQ